MSRRATEQESELDTFVRRLRNLGATDDEIATVRDTWDELDDDWTADKRAELVRLDDDTLRDELAATREEYRHDTRTEDEQEAVDATSYQAKLRADAADWIGQPVAKVLARVGDDVILAIAVLDLELGPDGAARKTLVEPLQALVAGSDETGIPVEIVGEGALPEVTDGEQIGEAIDGERVEVDGDEISGGSDVDAARGGDVDSGSSGEPADE